MTQLSAMRYLAYRGSQREAECVVMPQACSLVSKAIVAGKEKTLLACNLGDYLHAAVGERAS